MKELVRVDKSTELMRVEEENERLQQFKKALLEEIRSLLAEASAEEKTVLALNRLLARELTQAEAFNVEDIAPLLGHLQNREVLLENNLIYGPSELVGKNTLYLCVDASTNSKETLLSEEDVDRSVFALLDSCVASFNERNVPFDLKIYINTDDWNIHRLFEDSLKSTMNIPYTIISSITGVLALKKPDKTISQTAAGITVHEVLTNFFGSLKLSLSDRKLTIRLAGALSIAGLGPLDLTLVAMRNLRNLLVYEQEQGALAGHATKLWLDVSSRFKFMHETIEDFFSCPSVVLVRGLTPMYGIIRDRRLEIVGNFLDTDEEEAVRLIVDNNSYFSPLTSGYDFYLEKNIKNLRSSLITYNGRPLRVDKVVPEVVVSGRTIGSNLPINGLQIKEDLSNIVMLTPFYSLRVYDKLKDFKGVTHYSLPLRYDEYLYRKALMSGTKLPNGLVDEWFQHRNTRLSDVLEQVTPVVPITSLLGVNISGESGILVKDILVRSEHVCRTAIK